MIVFNYSYWISLTDYNNQLLTFLCYKLRVDYYGDEEVHPNVVTYSSSQHVVHKST